ncbi:hypothetical protein, partial [Fusibacter ferrireducens]|uniref:hypothetical protein n=1 Tax=Fusibacter ferrireducens TaxID=2785058 RepID=UPI001A9AA266
KELRVLIHLRYSIFKVLCCRSIAISTIKAFIQCATAISVYQLYLAKSTTFFKLFSFACFALVASL